MLVQGGFPSTKPVQTTTQRDGGSAVFQGRPFRCALIGGAGFLDLNLGACAGGFPLHQTSPNHHSEGWWKCRFPGSAFQVRPNWWRWVFGFEPGCLCRGVSPPPNQSKPPLRGMVEVPFSRVGLSGAPLIGGAGFLDLNLGACAGGFPLHQTSPNHHSEGWWKCRFPGSAFQVRPNWWRWVFGFEPGCLCRGVSPPPNQSKPPLRGMVEVPFSRVGLSGAP